MYFQDGEFTVDKILMCVLIREFDVFGEGLFFGIFFFRRDEKRGDSVELNVFFFDLIVRLEKECVE